ncbi:phage structural protein [Anaerosolibacter sp.]|uniref:phage structural protein n=1 Tax=Anaerosolibacter sp. TaxID=1872527 RepID=UPI0039EECCC3
METFDFKDVGLIVGGVYITGFAEGTAIQAEQTEDNFTPSVGADGTVAIAESNNKTGQITVTVKSTSPSNPYLMGLANSKKVVPVQIIDLNDNGMKAGGNECRVMKPPAAEWGNDVSSREYSIFVADYTQTI